MYIIWFKSIQVKQVNLKTSWLAQSLCDLMHWSSLSSLLRTYVRSTCSKSSSLGYVDSLAGQVTFKVHLPTGQGTRQASCNTITKLEQASSYPWQAKCESWFSNGHERNQVLFQPLHVLTEKRVITKWTYPLVLSFQLSPLLVPELFSHPLTFAWVPHHPRQRSQHQILFITYAYINNFLNSRLHNQPSII